MSKIIFIYGLRGEYETSLSHCVSPLRLTSLLECILFPSTSMAYASYDCINIVLYWAYAHSSRIAKMSTWQTIYFFKKTY